MHTEAASTVFTYSFVSMDRHVCLVPLSVTKGYPADILYVYRVILLTYSYAINSIQFLFLNTGLCANLYVKDFSCSFF